MPQVKGQAAVVCGEEGEVCWPEGIALAWLIAMFHGAPLHSCSCLTGNPGSDSAHLLADGASGPLPSSRAISFRKSRVPQLWAVGCKEQSSGDCWASSPVHRKPKDGVFSRRQTLDNGV